MMYPGLNYERRDYAAGTYLVQSAPWGFYAAGAALCADGKTRKLARIATTANTFFSVPAAVKVSGRTVAGYVTVTTLDDYSTATEDDPAVVVFHAYTYRKNADALPNGRWTAREVLARAAEVTAP